MNPPFGVKTRAADRIFLQKAFSFSDVVYSIHLAGEKNRKFISHFIKEFSWKIDNIIAFNMILERSYPFHNQKVKKIKVESSLPVLREYFSFYDFHPHLSV